MTQDFPCIENQVDRRKRNYPSRKQGIISIWLLNPSAEAGFLLRACIFHSKGSVKHQNRNQTALLYRPFDFAFSVQRNSRCQKKNVLHRFFYSGESFVYTRSKISFSEITRWVFYPCVQNNSIRYLCNIISDLAVTLLVYSKSYSFAKGLFKNYLAKNEPFEYGMNRFTLYIWNQISY